MEGDSASAITLGGSAPEIAPAIRHPADTGQSALRMDVCNGLIALAADGRLLVLLPDTQQMTHILHH